MHPRAPHRLTGDEGADLKQAETQERYQQLWKPLTCNAETRDSTQNQK
jgi:hypothetical protein